MGPKKGGFFGRRRERGGEGDIDMEALQKLIVETEKEVKWQKENQWKGMNKEDRECTEEEIKKHPELCHPWGWLAKSVPGISCGEEGCGFCPSTYADLNAKKANLNWNDWVKVSDRCNDENNKAAKQAWNLYKGASASVNGGRRKKRKKNKTKKTRKKKIKRRKSKRKTRRKSKRRRRKSRRKRR